MSARSATVSWLLTCFSLSLIFVGGFAPSSRAQLGEEKAIPVHLQDGEEFDVSLQELLEHGERLFTAVFTSQDGQGRPLTKGSGAPLSDPTEPLVFPRNFNRVSTPDANSCTGCHAQPFGVPGGDGDIVANVFVLAQRFDFATFDHHLPGSDPTPTKNAFDEAENPVTLQTIANSRLTLGMWGSGFIEMLARQMTADLQAIRDATDPGTCSPLVTKGVSFGEICRTAGGTYDTSGVEGLGAASLTDDPPNLIIRPFHQAGRVISIREFTNNAMNHHHGMQPTERFGLGTDPDGDGFVDELTRADITATAIFQATMSVPGQVIPNDPVLKAVVMTGETLFDSVGCNDCHVKSLPLDNEGWIFCEPNPFNPSGNLQPGDAPDLCVDLTNSQLPPPRLKARQGVVQVPAFTDLKLHDITSGPGDPNREPLDMHQPPGSSGFFAGNSMFVTRKLWGTGNTPPFFHHGQFTTIRESILAHAGEAEDERLAFEALAGVDQDSIIEFLKSLQVLTPPQPPNLGQQSVTRR